ncbi:hypothetical protein M409DRAFT_29148 [Zasmidium cellare ATCC 36951]|uniref:DUF7918 domain-containing protein n=1 Tax=Zasmidium cellare ATCC 36951 TaxID=1080233 RepID=A0A6A6C095_ZASCE|nr:uncharacterized protein M409DRAFT_29148 [Zasmidium cellare ATCC 36951]KAF2160293.1 hypothetical protein M409DRAFT_29148 [Zasmidium cellare ATCC 36951]
MAILNDLPRVEVTIRVNGQTLEEHRDRHLSEAPETISRYIEIQSGQTFEVHIKTNPGAIRGAGHKYVIDVDGNKVDWGLVEPRHCVGSPKVSISKGTRRKDGMFRPYKFNLFTTDDEGSKAQTSQTRNLGTIDVCIYQLSTVTKLPETPDPAARKRSTSSLILPAPLEPLSEKAVKLQELSHTVGFADALPVGKKRKHMTRVVYASGIPIATYRFYYRSRESLKNLDIVARTPPPPMLEDMRPIKREDED